MYEGFVQSLRHDRVEQLKLHLRLSEIALEYADRWPSSAQETDDFPAWFALQMPPRLGQPVKSLEQGAEELDLVASIHDLQKQLLQRLLDARRRFGLPLWPLHALRLEHASQCAETPEEFTAIVRSCVEEIDREAAAHRWPRLTSQSYYWRLSDELMRRIDSVTAKPGTTERENRAHGLLTVSWEKQRIRPLLQWLAAHKDPAVRVVGYYGLIRLQDEPEADLAEWSRKLLDTLLHNFPADNSDAILETCRGKYGFDFRRLYAPFDLPALGAAVTISAVGDYPAYVESIIKSAEKSRDLSVLLRWPPLIADLVYEGRQPYTVPWANRVLALIAAANVKKLSRVDCQALAALRKNVTYYRDQCLPQKYTPSPLGPWAEYVFKPIPLTGLPQDKGKSLGVEMIAMDRQAEAANAPEPLVMVWYRSAPQKPGDGRCRCVVTRVGIAGGALHEIARFMSQSSVIKAIALGNNTIFLAFEHQGLTVVRSQGVERYDEAHRRPAPTSTPWPGWTAPSISRSRGPLPASTRPTESSR